MTVVSKSQEVAVQLLASYLSQLYLHPIRTKSLTAGSLALLGNYASQSLAGAKQFDFKALRAFGLYGLIFGGTVPHYFYEFLRKNVNQKSKLAPIWMLLIERLLFMPLNQYFSLYMLGRFEGKNHREASSGVSRVYWPIVEANYRYLTLAQFLNLYFVPPMLRVLVANLIAFFWVVYLARKRVPRSSKKRV